jgi:hypothetical protein
MGLAWEHYDWDSHARDLRGRHCNACVLTLPDGQIVCSLSVPRLSFLYTSPTCPYLTVLRNIHVLHFLCTGHIATTWEIFVSDTRISGGSGVYLNVRLRAPARWWQQVGTHGTSQTALRERHGSVNLASVWSLNQGTNHIVPMQGQPCVSSRVIPPGNWWPLLPSHLSTWTADEHPFPCRPAQMPRGAVRISGRRLLNAIFRPLA